MALVIKWTVFSLVYIVLLFLLPHDAVLRYKVVFFLLWLLILWVLMLTHGSWEDIHSSDHLGPHSPREPKPLTDDERRENV